MNVITHKDNENFIIKLLIEYQNAILDGRDIAFEKATDNIWDAIEEYYNKLFKEEE